jgi:hypothetical protein
MSSRTAEAAQQYVASKLVKNFSLSILYAKEKILEKSLMHV